jgi:hypothetical protein
LNKYWYGALIAFAAGTIAVIVLFYYGKLVPDTSQGMLSFAKDIVSIIIPIASFAVGTYYARKAQIFQQEMADRKAEPHVLINNSELTPEDQLGIREVVFGYSVEKRARVFCVVPFIIRNKGELDAENVHLRVTLPSNVSAHRITEIDARKVLGDLEGSGFRRKSYEYENYWIIDYLIPRITPGNAAGIEELVDMTYSSAADFDVDALTKDKVNVTIKVQLPLVSRVSVSLSATDTKPFSSSFFLKSYETTNEKEIARKIIREREDELGEELRKLEAGTAAKARPVDLLRKAIVVVPELRKIAETKEHSHFTTIYVEQAKRSKRWILNPAPKNGIVEIDLKKLMSRGTSETHSS